MDFFRRAALALVTPCLVIALVAPAFAQNVGFTTGSSAASFQVLTSGPLHESFARPVVYTTSNVAYIRSTPPALIDEVIPLTRPAGNSVWIPGYWNWDDAASNWIWVSGTWRVQPAGYTWVPGYWYQTSRGWRYVQGYWALATTADADIDYLPAPPEPLDLTPVGTAPVAEAIWSPGNWVWGGSSYGWRDGYWVTPRADYVWTPASYSWTPYGYIYSEGYWDYAFANRGLLYAPVSFTPGSYLTSGFSYTPDYVINTSLFADSLFVRPYDASYYFGDYYAPTWWGYGYYPAYAFHMSRYGYDPLFAWNYWRLGQNNDRWLAERRARFMNLRDNPVARPPRTLDEQARRPVAVPGATEGETAAVAVAAKDVATANVTPLKIEAVPESARQDLMVRAKETLAARSERIKLETQTEIANGEMTQAHKVRASKALMPRAGEIANMKSAAPEKPALPKVEANVRGDARRAEAARLHEPSPDKAPLADMKGRGEAKPEGGKPEGIPPKPTPPGRPEGVPPIPPKRPEGVPPTPPARPEGVPPKPEGGGKPEGVPPTPPRKPEGVPPQPLPPARPEGKRPEPPQPQPPQPKPDAGKPQPPPQPRGNPPPPQPRGNPPPAPHKDNPPPPPKPDGGGKPDEKPHGNPKPKEDSASRPADGADLMRVA